MLRLIGPWSTDQTGLQRSGSESSWMRCRDADNKRDERTVVVTASRNHILFVISSLGGGGAERVISWLAGGLADRGYMVTVLVRSAAGNDKYSCGDKVRVVREGIRPSGRILAKAPLAVPPKGAFARLLDAGVGGLRDLHRLRQDAGLRSLLRSLVVEEHVDAVVAFGEREALAALMALRGRPVPVIVHETSHPFAKASFGPIRNLLRRQLYPAAHGVVVLSTELVEAAEVLWPRARVLLTTNPVLLGPVQPPPPHRAQRVLAVGRLQPVKDHLTLIRAWSLAHEACPGWTLRIVGEGPLRGVLEDEVTKLGVEGSVEFAGYLEDVAVEYAASCVFVLPSLLEGFPNVLVEAMAAGCACVATACPGGPKEILGFGRHGLLVDPANPEQLAEALRKLVQHPEERVRLGRSAQDRAKEFAPSRVLAFWSALVERAVESSRSGAPRVVS